MPASRSSSGPRNRSFVQKHGLLISIWLALCAAAVGANVVLRGDILPDGSVSGGSSSSASSISTAACSSKGTPFESLQSARVVTNTFKSGMSAVVQEREELLRSVSKWNCAVERGDDIAPPMRNLQALAASLPGWKVRHWSGREELKPVTFASFSGIVGEYQRMYECKMSELKLNPLAQAVNEGALTDPDATIGSVGRAAGGYAISIDNDIAKSRFALERTLLTLRSYEHTAGLTSRLHCLIREEMDIKTELTLLADAMSCIPRIWDAATSLHDRDPDSPYVPPASSSSAP